MARRQVSFPLYLHITLLSVVLVVVTGETLRWFGDAIPGELEFFLLVAFAAGVALLISRRIAAPLTRLASESEAVRRFDFTDHPIVRSSVREIDTLGAAFDLMRDAVRRFLRINQRLVSETDFEILRPWLLDKLVDIAEARGGALYLADASGALRVSALDVEGGKAKPAPNLPPLSPDALPKLMEAARTATHPVSGHLSSEELAALGLDAGLAIPAMLALPLRDRHEQLLGMLLLFKDEQIDDASARFIEALTASAASALETQELIKEQKALIQATIRMIAGAIDEKSPYTGGHCARVPELTFMLARAACAQDRGTYADFRLDDDGWEQLHIAAWLHDCGKVTTPEYVVDKATKLETVYNRIHEVRMRFEVLKRDAWIDYWRRLAEGGPEPELRATRDALLTALDDEFVFVARCNVGGEFLPPEQQARLREIGSRRWLRTLDDRLGLSREELDRLPQPVPELPLEEPLLADRPEHRIPRPESERIEAGNRWGFKMETPELLYDRGELHNLTISRGTLTNEERYKINQHIVQTIKMLSELPLPRHLREVPQIAGGHHEKMDGAGYPCRLDASQLSLEARMMAIADIFEALTAADRPYKPAKTISESIAIMARMCKDSHIDPDLFALFLRSGVHLEYARRDLRPEQIDAVDVEKSIEASRG